MRVEPFKSAASDAGKTAISLFGEFKNFAFKGNVIDLSIGVIIGTAFGKLVDSLVKQLIMPILSVLLPGEQSYLTWKWEIAGKAVPYGLFLGELINFLIVSFALFLFAVKFLGWIVKTKKEEAASPPPPTLEQQLLVEIRDLLKEKHTPSNPTK